MEVGSPILCGEEGAASEDCLKCSPKNTDIEERLGLDEKRPLKLITWNIDGLDEENLIARTEAVCRIIEEEQADIVFLQEIVLKTYIYIQVKMSKQYRCCFSDEEEGQYFVGTLLKRSTVSFIDSQVIHFPGSRMFRNLLKVNAKFKDVPLCLLNSHLESLKKYSTERKNQLRRVVSNILRAPRNETVIFGGDTNLRDKELSDLGGLPPNIEDVWETCGSREECAYTFDLLLNDNLEFEDGSTPRLRYDRVFFRPSSPSKMKPVFFGLIGQERISPDECFPSDHFGILCHFEIEELLKE